MNILLVEPDNIIAESMISKFSEIGNVVHEKNAQSALNSIEKIIPDVIVLELQLGDHNGIEFLHELRSYTEWQMIPVIVNTRNIKATFSQYKKAFLQLGVKEVLYKPKTSNLNLLNKINYLYGIS